MDISDSLLHSAQAARPLSGHQAARMGSIICKIFRERKDLKSMPSKNATSDSRDANLLFLPLSQLGIAVEHLSRPMSEHGTPLRYVSGPHSGTKPRPKSSTT